MNHNRSQQALVHLSLLVSLLLTILPWPSTVQLFMPQWAAMVIAYWSLHDQNRSVMFLAFFYGLLLDILMGSLLGKHGMSLVALSFLVLKSAKQLRMTSFWQLMLMVLVLLFNDVIIRLFIDWVSFGYLPVWQDFLPLLTVILIWPWLHYLLNRINTHLKQH
ncbi:rod shape-determining protein MreD [Marinicella gelatinilytica]|uniref:rod shape-determining protein MreD n=1 Tax=Marinicella gelatinilytica TaxID=2996017 RepID=UPI002260FDF4|nr:rod shape-determining protein MreD [Marinicella gelatinilytica]MCX7545558.1 rod shape-determining protein MreD [Marinicella gelatinilytica]